MRRNSTPEAALFMKYLTIITLILSSIGALCALKKQTTDVYKLIVEKIRGGSNSDKEHPTTKA